MILALIGESGAGKSTLEEVLVKKGWTRIIPHTSRDPRDGEVNGVHYHFVDSYEFRTKIDKGEMIEYELYSQDRFYGVSYDAIKTSKGNNVVILTPNGYRALKKQYPDDVVGVYITASLGTRMIRYIKRVGISNFNFDDKNEISARVERDYGMFLNIYREVDVCLYNNGECDIDGVLYYLQDFLRTRELKEEKLIKLDQYGDENKVPQVWDGELDD